MASDLHEHIHEAFNAFCNQFDTIPIIPPEGPSDLKDYIVTVGEALACHDEMRVLQQLARQKGSELRLTEGEHAEAYQAFKKGLQGRLQELLRLVHKSPPHPALHNLECSELRRIIPELCTVRKSSHIVLLRQEEERLKSRYARLLPSPTAPRPSVEKVEVVPLSLSARKKNWLNQAKAWEEHKDAREQVFTELIAIRKQLATALGFDSYADYLAHRRHSLKWLPDKFLSRLAAITSPLLRSAHEFRKSAFRLKRLRPFDLNTREIVGTLAFPQWKERMERLMERMHPCFAAYFRRMLAEDLIETRETHAGTCLHLQYSRRPYVQAPGGISPKDLMEIGHGIHILFADEQEIPFYRTVTPLPGELAALSVELLASPHLEVFFEDSGIAVWARRKNLESVLAVFSTALSIGCFEEEIYSNDMSSAARQKAFEGIMRKHLGLVDYTGYESVLRIWYHRIPTLVFSPGYFLYYAAAQAGALAVSQTAPGPGSVPTDFMRFLRQGARFTDERLYETAGVSPGCLIAPQAFEELGRELHHLYRESPLSESDGSRSEP